MARALWSGAIAFGLVNIPVKLYGATESKDLCFTTLHSSCMTALRRPYVCPKDNVPVESKDMVKGYEYAKGQYVILTDKDFDSIPLEASKALEVAGFVESQDISPILRERNYYLGPEEISLKPFELFRQALLRTGKVAIARAVLWKKEQLVSISPLNGSLVLTTLMHQDEVKSPPEPPATQPVVISEAELDLALQLIKTLVMEFDLSRYKDRYRDALMQLIQDKVKGKEPPDAVNRGAVPETESEHEEARDPRRRDRRDMRREAELREAAGARTSRNQDPPGLSGENTARDLRGLRRPLHRRRERDGQAADGAEGPSSRGPRGGRSDRAQRLRRGARGRLLQRRDRARPGRHHRETQGCALLSSQTYEGLDQDQEEDDPRLRDRGHHGRRRGAGGHLRLPDHGRVLPGRAVPRRPRRHGILRALPAVALSAARRLAPGGLPLPRGPRDRRPRRVLDPAGDCGRGPLPRVLEGPAYARPFLLALAGGQAARGLRRHVLGASRGPAVRRPRSPPTITRPCGVLFRILYQWPCR